MTVAVTVTVTHRCGGNHVVRDHRIRLHADTEAFGFTHVSRDAAPGNTNIVGFGLGRPPFLDGGFVRPVWGVGLAYVFDGRRVVLGARFAFAVDGVNRRNDDFGSTRSVAGNFVPYFRWVFLPERRFRPYLTARFGLSGGTLIEPIDENSKFQELRRTDVFDEPSPSIPDRDFRAPRCR